jgi:hypothetical protein
VNISLNGKFNNFTKYIGEDEKNGPFYLHDIMDYV